MSIVNDIISMRSDIIGRKTKKNTPCKTDKYLKVCPKCKKVYEHNFRYGGYGKKLIYYDNIPTIGKERKTCEKCK